MYINVCSMYDQYLEEKRKIKWDLCPLGVFVIFLLNIFPSLVHLLFLTPVNCTCLEQDPQCYWKKSRETLELPDVTKQFYN